MGLPTATRSVSAQYAGKRVLLLGFGTVGLGTGLNRSSAVQTGGKRVVFFLACTTTVTGSGLALGFRGFGFGMLSVTLGSSLIICVKGLSIAGVAIDADSDIDSGTGF